MLEEELPVHLDGLNVDAAYENFVRQIAGDTLQTSLPLKSQKESMAWDDRREDLRKHIDKLRSKKDPEAVCATTIILAQSETGIGECGTNDH